MKEVIISAEMLEEYSRPKIAKWKGRSPRQRMNYHQPKFYPICVGCGKILISGDRVYEFRNLTFTHTLLECVRSINKYVMTKELKALV